MATETTQQIVREAPEIEAYKLDLLKQAKQLAFNEGRTPLADQLPGFNVAGFAPAQQTAMNAAIGQGIGAFDPYLTSANQAVTQAYGTTGEAANVLRGADTRDQYGLAQDVLLGADTRNQFPGAYQAMGQAGQATGNITSNIGQIGQGLGYLDAAAQRAAMSDTTGQFRTAREDIDRGIGSLATGQNMASLYSQANLQPATSNISQGIGGLTQAQQLALGARGADFGGSQALLGQAAQQAQLAAAQPGFNQAQGTIQQGIGQLGGATQGYDPGSAQAFMDPYRQKVIDETLRQIERQGTIAQQGLSAQAVRAGAFGGTREGVQRAELERGLLEQKSNTIANLLSQGYSQAQAQAMQSFEQQQGRQMQAGQGIGQLGAQQAAVAGQQAGLGQSAAQQLAQVGQTIGQQAAQQAQLGQATAGLYGNLAQNQVAAGQGLGQLGLQQAQLGQGAAGQYLQAAQQYGNLAGQGGALAGQESAINQNIANLMMQQSQARNQAAQTTAGIYGQQAQQFQGLGQGIGALAGQEFGQGQQLASTIGSLAGQEFGQGQQMSSGLGQLGAQMGQLGIQQGALGQTAQAMRQGDINFLYNVGQSQQAMNQQQLDAQRATELQKVYSPYQQAAFLSDIYKGAPSTQMSTAAVSQPSASPFQQALGVGLGVVSTAAGAKKAGLF